MLFSINGNIFRLPIKSRQAKLLVNPLQKARISAGKSSPESRNGKVCIPSWTEKTRQHAVNSDTHFKMFLTSSLPVKRKGYIFHVSIFVLTLKLSKQLEEYFESTCKPWIMKSFSIRRSQVAKQNRETIVKIADTIYIKRRRWLSSNCERRREDNKRTKPMIIADRYAFSDVWTSGGHDSFVILIFACKIKKIPFRLQWRPKYISRQILYNIK